MQQFLMKLLHCLLNLILNHVVTMYQKILLAAFSTTLIAISGGITDFQRHSLHIVAGTNGHSVKCLEPNQHGTHHYPCCPVVA